MANALADTPGENLRDAYTLSQSQLNIWSLEQAYSNTPINNICETLRIRGRFDIPMLQKTLDLLVASDSTLRTRMIREGDALLQYEAEYVPERFSIFDFSKSDEDGLHHWERSIAKEVMQPINAPLYYFAIFKLGEHEGGVLLKCHHIISDGWSQVLLINKLADTYLKLLAGEEVALEAAPSYRLHVESEEEYHASRHYTADRNYWQEVLADPAYPAALRETGGAALSPVGQRLSFGFSNSLNHAIYNYCTERRVAPFAVFYMALALYIKRTAGAERFCVGVPIYNRINLNDRDTSGMFVSTLPFINRLDEDWSFSRFTEEAMINWYDLLRHQRLPFAEIMEIAALQGQGERQLSELAFSFQSSRIYANKEASVSFSGEWHYSGYQAEQLCIHLSNMEEDNRFRVNYDYLTQIFSEKNIADLHKYLTTILTRALAEPERSLRELSMVDAAEEEKVVYEFNPSASFVPARNVYEQLAEIARYYPSRAAVIFAGQRYSYTALLRRANDYALALKSRLGEGAANEVVALILPRSFELMAAMSGIAQSGRAWLLIGANLPPHRVEEMLAGSNAVAVIGNETAAEQYKLSGGELPLIIAEKLLQGEAESFLPSPAMPEDTAYLVYTSGSSGKPKAVEISGRSLLNFAMDMEKYYAHGAVLSLNNISFDAFLVESMVALLNGCTLVMLPEGSEEDPAAVASHIVDYAVGFLTMTPGRLAAYLNDKNFRRACSRLESVVCGGEAFPPALLRQLSLLSQARIYNQYGPSETTVGVTIKQLNGAAQITAGRPMANCRIYVLDKQMKPLPVGVCGDIYIGGANVGKGYRNQPELTAAVFLKSPFEPDELIYRSGDFGYWTEQGELALRGREDNQVKLRGMRVELDEIAARLSLHPRVVNAAALVFESHGQQLVAAYYTSEEAVAERELLELATTYLPYYMVPASFIRVPELPLTANGKLDTSRLPAPQSAATDDDAPMSRLEEKVLAIFREVLGNPELTRNSDYFMCGGSSLNAMETLSRLEEEFHVRLHVADIYSCRRASRLARLLGAPEVTVSPAINLRQAPLQESYPLSPVQQSLYFQTMLADDKTSYNMPGAVILPPGTDLERLEAAFRSLIAAEEIFRTGFSLEQGKLVQKIAAHVDFSLEQLQAADFAAAAQAFIRPFNLSEAPLMRAAVWRDEQGRDILFVDTHHLIGDGLSAPLIFSRLNKAYTGRALAVPALAYKDYAYWLQQNGANKEADIAYWRDTLAELPEPLDIPTDLPRPAHFDYRGVKYCFDLDAELSGRLAAYSSERGFTPAVLFAASFAILLSRLSNSDDIIMGIPVSSRNMAELEGLIGPFINTQPLRLRPYEDLSLAAYLEQVQQRLLGSLDHQQLSLEELLRLSQAPRAAGRNPLYQTLFSLRPVSSDAFRLGNEPLDTVPLENHTAKLELSLEAVEEQGSYSLIFEYASSLFAAETMEFWARAYKRILTALLTDEAVLLGDLDCLDERDRFELLEKPNYLRSPFLDQPLDMQFSRMAKLYPNREALICDGEVLTYRELEQRALAIAGQLQAAGVLPGDRIALLSRRNSDMIAALLGINKGGCAYVPLSKAFPEGRIAYILENSGAALILGDSESLAKLPAELPCGVLAIADESPAFSAPAKRQTSDLIHILYTSGSTGKPKGAALCHRALANLLAALTPLITGATGRVLCATNITFDIFITESLLPLSLGKTVVLANDEEMLLPWKTAELMTAHEVTMLQMTPSRLQMCLGNEAFFAAMAQAEIIITVGEPLNRELIRLTKATGNVKLMNLYGPVEATVYVSGAEMTGVGRPHIGKPLANCRIYILDEQRRPVFPTARGELYLAGPCLAEGYCNDPELTEAVFMADPFFPGERMYKTGDLGRLLPDGNIEFLGRSDNQIKINGQRVELDEINSAILNSGLFKEAVTVVSQSKEGGTKLHTFVAGFSSAEPDLQALRQHLQKLLPDYMLPAEIVPVAEMPRNASGKTDVLKLRQQMPALAAAAETASVAESELEPLSTANAGTALDAPAAEAADITATAEPAASAAAIAGESLAIGPAAEPALSEAAALAPANESAIIPETAAVADAALAAAEPSAPTLKVVSALAISEAELLRIWQSVLDREDIDENMSFFEQGGSSFAALNLLSQCFNQGLTMTLAQFYDNPTLRGQKAFLTGSSPAASPAAAAMPALAANTASAASNRAILLTGATGFFGAHLLRLMCEAGEQVLCLVRGDGQRLYGVLESYFGVPWLAAHRSAIETVDGDITKPDLGLQQDISGRVKSVYHAAADVRHYAVDDNSYLINQVGTGHVIDFALRARAELHHMSTLSVCGEYLLAAPKQPAVFTENDRDIGQNWRDNIYIRYKFEAENLVFAAKEKGLRARVYRLGRLGCRQSDGRFQLNPEGNSYWESLRGLALLTMIPAAYGALQMELTPVDEAARAVWLLRDCGHACLHIANNKLISLKELVTVLRGEVPMESSQEEFEAHLGHLLSQDRRLAAFIELYSRLRLGRPPIEPSVDITVARLAERGFTWQDPATIDYSQLWAEIRAEGRSSQ
jgi:amino acid adenylation domain-containing protein